MSCVIMGFPAVNSNDLVPAGYIHPILSTIHQNPGPKVESPGVSYQDSPSGLIETRKQLPAKAMFLDIKFRKLIQSSTQSIADMGGSGFGALGGGAGGLIDIIASTTVMGGLSAGNTDFIIQLIDGQSRYNYPIRVTDDILESGIIKLDANVIGVLCVTKDQIDANNYVIEYNGIKNKIDDVTGQIITKDSIANNLFISIRRKDIRYIYRDDFADSEKSSRSYVPFSTYQQNDVQDDEIIINTDGLSSGDIVYLTASVSKKQYLRQAIRHRGTVATTSSRTGGADSQTFGVSSSVDAWNFVPCKWTLGVSSEQQLLSGGSGSITGWRLSRLITDKYFEKMIAADSRGIFLFNNGSIEILINRSSIRDQNWFNLYLQENGLEDSELTISPESFYGSAFDISIVSNSFVFDSDKVPYYRPFSEALKRVSAYKSDTPGTGIGIALYDIVNILPNASLNNCDMSFAQFSDDVMSSYRPDAYGSFTCTTEGSPDVWFSPRDPLNSFTTSINNVGGETESDWLITTPFIYDKFTRNSRIYTEYFTGQKIDPFILKYSMLYARTIYGGSSSMSIIDDIYRNNSIVAFSDSDTDKMSYHMIDNGNYYASIDNLKFSSTSNVDNADLSFKGENLIIGDRPSFSNGRILMPGLLDECGEPKNISTDIISNVSDGEISFSPNKHITSMSIFYSSINKDSTSNEFWIKFDDLYTIDDCFINYRNNVFTTRVDGYNGSVIKLGGASLSNMNIERVEISYIDSDMFSKCSQESEYMSMSIDCNGIYYCFCENTESNNIDVLVSSNGIDWDIYRSMIIIDSSESAGRPMSITSRDGKSIDLFFYINDDNLFCKRIHTSLFDCSDIDISASADGVYDSSYDINKFVSPFSSSGQKMRTSPCYAIYGSEAYLSEQQEIISSRINANLPNRFVIGEEVNTGELLTESVVSVIRDRTGMYYAFILSEGTVSILRSGDMFIWTLLASDVYIHRYLKADSESSPTEVPSTMSVIYDSRGDTLYMAYVVNDKMYLRQFVMSVLASDPQDSLSIDNYNSNNRPIFIIGHVDAEEISYVANDEAIVYYPQGAEILSEYSSSYEVDGFCQPTGIVDSKGFVRIFYKDGNGKVLSVVVNIETEANVVANGVFAKADFQLIRNT